MERRVYRNLGGALLLLAVVSFSARAGTVDESQVTTFQAGSPAIAADVNATIGALVTAINDNAARIQALELNNDPSVVGHTYQVVSLDVLVSSIAGGADDTPSVAVLTGGAQGTVTISGSSASGSGTVFEAEVFYGEGAAAVDPGPIGPGFANTTSLSESSSLQISSLFVSADGNVFIGQITETSSGSEAEPFDEAAGAGIVVGVRVVSQAP